MTRRSWLREFKNSESPKSEAVSSKDRSHWGDLFTWNGPIALLCLVVMGSLLGLTLYYVNLPDHLSQHETIVLGQRRLIPGTQAALRVVVRDSRDATPLSNATVNVLMRPQDGNRAIPLFEGRTDVDGNINVTFTVPENATPEQMLIIETRSDLGSDSLEHPVRVRRDSFW